MLRPSIKDEADADRQGGRRWSFPDWRRRLEKIRDPGPRSLLPRASFSFPSWESSSEDSERPTRKRRFRLGHAAPSKRKLNFLRLPLKFRQHVYSLLLVRDEPMTVLWRPRAGRSLGILRACKVTWREGTPVLYGQNRLDFSKVEPAAAARFLGRIGPRNAGDVRHLIIDFPGIRFDPETLEWVDEPDAVGALAPYTAHCIDLRTLAISQVSTVDIFLNLPQLGRADDVIHAAFVASNTHEPNIRIQVSRNRADWEPICFHSRLRGWRVEWKEDYDPRKANGGTGLSRRFALD